MKVLIVDDSSTMRRIIRQTMGDMGAEVEEADCGEVALEMLRATAGEFDLVLMDWNMPGLNGFDALIAIKSDETISAVPVMMVTTEAEKAQVVRAIQAGACQYVVKPFDKENLINKVKKSLVEM